MFEKSDFDGTVHPFPTQSQLARRHQALSQARLAEYTLEKGASGAQPNSPSNYAKMDGVSALLQQL